MLMSHANVEGTDADVVVVIVEGTDADVVVIAEGTDAGVDVVPVSHPV